jgi:hypothetical protein
MLFSFRECESRVFTSSSGEPIWKLVREAYWMFERKDVRFGGRYGCLDANPGAMGSAKLLETTDVTRCVGKEVVAGVKKPGAPRAISLAEKTYLKRAKAEFYFICRQANVGLRCGVLRHCAVILFTAINITKKQKSSPEFRGWRVRTDLFP